MNFPNSGEVVEHGELQLDVFRMLDMNFREFLFHDVR